MPKALNRPQAVTPWLWRTLFKRGRKPLMPLHQLNGLVAVADPVYQHYRQLSAAHLNQYHQVVEWPNKQMVHPCYLHLLAFPQHLQILLSEHVPFAVIGLVHLHNRITANRPLSVTDGFILESKLAGFEQHNKGTVVRIVSQASDSQGLLWESSSDFLSRHSLSPGNQDRVDLSDFSLPGEGNVQHHRWCLDSDLGRKYAGVSGDYNPIHLWDVTAKLLGFKQHIAHGMCSKARSISQLHHLIDDKLSCEVEFVKPVFLPAQVDFHFTLHKSRCIFTISSQSQQRCHLAGSLDF